MSEERSTPEAPELSHRRALPRFWFLPLPAYRLYMVREATSLFLVGAALDLGAGWLCLVRGPQAWELWRAVHAHPLGLLWTGLTLLAALFHSATWFEVAPKAAPQVFRGRPVPAGAVTAGLWLAFAGISAAILLLGGR